MTPEECALLAEEISAGRGPEWTSHLDPDDIATMVAELRAGPAGADELVEAWRVTAGVWADIADDPGAARALLGPHQPDDFVEVDRP